MKIKSLTLGALSTNCYIIQNDRDPSAAMLIDPAAQPQRILKELEKEHLTLEAVLLTHTHFDHFEALDEVIDATGAKLYCPLKDQRGLGDFMANGSVLFYRTPILARKKPDQLLSEGDVIPFGNETLTVVETPGHTLGSICYDTGKQIFTGDTLFCGGYGRTDLPGGSDEELFYSLKKIFALGERDVYPGHGPTTNLSAERQLFGYNQ